MAGQTALKFKKSDGYRSKFQANVPRSRANMRVSPPSNSPYLVSTPEGVTSRQHIPFVS